MPFVDYFEGGLALNGSNGDLQALSTFVAFLPGDITETPLVVRAKDSGVIISPFTSSAKGTFIDFTVDGAPTQIVIASGGFRTTMTSVYGAVIQAGLDPDTVAAAIASAAEADLSATAAAASAAEAAASAAGSGGGSGGVSSWNDLTDKPSTFLASAHTHPASQISDASAVGIAVLTAANAAAQRAAMGAGTGNGTSNLALGTTSSTAAPGNHAHGAAAVTFTPSGPLTATTVQDALVQAAGLVTGAPTLANIPAGSTITVYGDPTRPTSRTDVIVQWINATQPTHMNLSVDIWLNV